MEFQLTAHLNFHKFPRQAIASAWAYSDVERRCSLFFNFYYTTLTPLPEIRSRFSPEHGLKLVDYVRYSIEFVQVLPYPIIFSLPLRSHLNLRILCLYNPQFLPSHDDFSSEARRDTNNAILWYQRGCHNKHYSTVPCVTTGRIGKEGIASLSNWNSARGSI